MVPEAGDIYLADLNDEQRGCVLVVSTARFHDLSGRAIVVPASHQRPFPWRIEHRDDTFAIDLLQTISIDRLLEKVGTAPDEIRRRAQQTIRLIT